METGWVLLLVCMPAILFALAARLAMLPVAVTAHDSSTCGHCGYDLRGLPLNVGSICPECGGSPQSVHEFVFRPSAVTWRSLRAPLIALAIFTLLLLVPLSVLGSVLDAMSVRQLGYSWSVAWKVAGGAPHAPTLLVLVPLTAYLILSPGLFRLQNSDTDQFWMGLILIAIPTAFMVLLVAQW